jgi:thiamine biosynthesis lipoprotein
MLALLLAGCRGADTPVFTTQFVAFDSAVDLSIVGVSRQQALEAAQQAERELIFLDHAWHAWEAGPMLRVNELLPRGEPFAAPPSLLPLIRQSLVLAQQSDNLFNPAVGRLQTLWGFHTDVPECRPPPSSAAIRRLVRAQPTMADLYLDGILLQSDNPAVQLDFDAIATGAAMDIVMKGLRDQGIRNALINAGGNLRVSGNRAGRPWRAPVRRAGGTAVMGIIDISGDASLFTSGNHRRNFIYEGTLYHNVIDPRSGWPANGFQAVTVLYDGDAAVANAAATALMVAGPERWHEIAQRMGIHDVLAVDEAGTLHMSPSMQQRIQLLDSHPDIVVSAPLVEEPDDG